MESPDLHFERFYPVEGDTAIAELLVGNAIWGDLRLENIDLTSVGAQRTADARTVIRLYAPTDGTVAWEFDLEEVTDMVRSAADWLLVNEQGRLP